MPRVSLPGEDLGDNVGVSYFLGVPIGSCGDLGEVCNTGHNKNIVKQSVNKCVMYSILRGEEINFHPKLRDLVTCLLIFRT